MKCAIMQPTYIPWIGYFHMIENVDTFVFLNDVQFSKRSWQQRNQIESEEGAAIWLTVPVETKGKRTQLISEAKIVTENDWLKRHMNLIESTYKDHPYYKDVKNIYASINPEEKSLENLNIQLIKIIAEKFELKTNFLKSSELNLNGRKSEHLLNICEAIGATTYLSAKGSQEYIEQEGHFKHSNIKVQYHSGKPYTYKDHYNNKKSSYLSIIDYIANCGYEKGVFKENESNLFD